MRSQNFGIEIEMTGLTRAAAARIIAGYFGTQATHIGGTYDTYTVRDSQNRRWKLVSDASILCRNSSNLSASRDYSVEFVSPICKYEDIATVQELVRKLRAGGARVNDSCGIHVHVDASAHSPQTLRNIVNIMASKYDVMEKIADYFDVSVDYLLGREKTALQTERWLDEAYCGKLSRRQLLELCEALPAEKRRLLHGFLYLLGQEETKV